MGKFKVGDRVRIRKDLKEGEKIKYGVASEMARMAGREFTIAAVYDDCIRLSDEARRWTWHADMLEPSTYLPVRSSIHITTDGHTVHAILKDCDRVVKRSKAVCAPSDTFDFETGARIAFDRLCGTAELAAEPIALYCVKDFMPGKFLTKGKTYMFDGHCVNYDNLECIYAKDFDDWKQRNPSFAKCLVPEVKRRAKVGEWVKIVGGAATGVIGKVLDVDGNGRPLVYHPKVWFGDKDGMETTRFTTSDHVVLDGYQPEPEKPTYYSGKVVCVDNTGNPTAYTIGKVYSIIDGYLTDDRCKKINSDPVKSLQDWHNFTASKFIEFKGEQS